MNKPSEEQIKYIIDELTNDNDIRLFTFTFVKISFGLIYRSGVLLNDKKSITIEALYNKLKNKEFDYKELDPK